jgi:hypothetical protein
LQPRELLPELKVLTLELPFRLEISAQPMPQPRRDIVPKGEMSSATWTG